jgi:phosphoribosylamine--glycine ligase
VARNEAGQLITAGGRVLAVTAVAPDVVMARRRAYEAASLVTWSGKFARADIAADVGAADVERSDLA